MEKGEAQGFSTKGIDFVFFLFTILIITAIPLVYDPSNFQIFALPKAFLLKFGIGLVSLFWCVSFLTRPASISPLRNSHPFFWPLLSLLCVYGLATYFSIDPWMSYVGVYGRFFGLQGLLSCFLAYLMITSTSHRKNDHHMILLCGFFTAAVVGFYGLLQFMAMDPLNSHWFLFPYGKIYSTTGNANFCGNFLALVFPLSFYLVGTAGNKWVRGLYALGALFILGGIVTAQTRGAWAGAFASFVSLVVLANFFIVKQGKWDFIRKAASHILLMGSLFFICAWFVFTLFETPENFFYPLPFLRLIYVFWPFRKMYFKQGQKGQVKSWRFFYFNYLLSMFLLAFLYFMGRKTNFWLSTKFFTIFEFDSSIRIYLWKDFFSFIKEYFWLGSGPETYRRAFMPFKGLILGSMSAEEHDNPHNIFLSLWAGVGILGPICYIWIYSLLLKGSYQVIKTTRNMNDKLLGISFFSMTVSYLVWSIPAFDTVVNFPTFISFLGAFALWKAGLGPVQEVGREGRGAFILQGLTKIRMLGATRVIFLLAIIPLQLSSAYFVFQHRRADQLFLKSIVTTQRVEYYFSKGNKRDAMAAIAEAMDWLTQSLGFNPQESYYHFHLARLYFEQAKVATDAETLEKFLTLHEKALQKADEHPWAPESIAVERMYASVLRKNYPEALINGEKVLKIQPYRVDVRQSMEKLYYTTKEWMTRPELVPKIIENAEIILKLDPQYLFSRLFLIDIHLTRSDFMAAYDQVYFIKENFPERRLPLLKVVDRINLVRRDFLQRRGLSQL